jgi:hypothetical protein
MRLQDLYEARKPAPVAPVDFKQILDRLMAISGRLVHRPFDIEWDYRYGKRIKELVEADKARHIADHDPDYDGPLIPLEDRDLYTEYLPGVWRNLVTGTFSAVRNQIAQDTLGYQKRHGERLDHEAGHPHDMHFIEDSDWLRAMEEQKRLAEAIAHSAVDGGNSMSTLVDRIEAFTDDWPHLIQTDQRDEPMIVEAMFEGLAGAIPLLLLVAKKSI